MTTTNKILLFFVLPALAPLLFPLDFLLKGFWIIVLDIVLFVSLGIFLLRGRSLALTLAIFLQGLNVIIRLMMFLPNTKPATGPVDLVFALVSILSMGLSIYLLMRLDQVDVRTTMVT